MVGTLGDVRTTNYATRAGVRVYNSVLICSPSSTELLCPKILAGAHQLVREAARPVLAMPRRPGRHRFY